MSQYRNLISKSVLFLFLLSLGARNSKVFAWPFASDKPLETVAQVDLKRYMGLWYEIARLPNFFEKNCFGITANYEFKEDNSEVKVVNTCREGSLTGPAKEVVGRARVVDTQTNAKLKVSFFWIFWAPYWILELDSDYQYAVVGDPSRDYLWILSRKPQMSPELYSDLLSKAQAKGFDTSKIIKVAQSN